MKENMLWIVGFALLALVFLGLIMGKKLTKGKFNIGKSISGEYAPDNVTKRSG